MQSTLLFVAALLSPIQGFAVQNKVRTRRRLTCATRTAANARFPLLCCARRRCSCRRLGPPSLGARNLQTIERVDASRAPQSPFPVG